MPTVFAPFSFKALTTDICKSSCGCPPSDHSNFNTYMLNFFFYFTSTIPFVSFKGTLIVGLLSLPLFLLVLPLTTHYPLKFLYVYILTNLLIICVEFIKNL